MKLRAAAWGFALVTAVYGAVLVWANLRYELSKELGQFASAAPLIALAISTSYLLRYLRWRGLLLRSGSRAAASVGFSAGLLAYLAGFAFTATPGKVGELVRIRYLSRLGVMPRVVVAAFVYERLFDLLAVLLLASLIAESAGLMGVAAGFVLLLGGTVLALVSRPRFLGRLAALARRRGWRRLARLAFNLRGALLMCRVWFNWPDAARALALGLAAWSLTAFTLVYLLGHLGIVLPGLSAWGMYPLAMLAGAASMLPGGLGSTEVALVLLLTSAGVSVGVATLVAVAIRLSTLWFSIACGFAALLYLEWRHAALTN